MGDKKYIKKINMINNDKTLKIAVQKSDRISQDFLNLINQCGLKTDGLKTKLYCKLNDLPIELYFIRGNDIPSLIENYFDCAVLGEDSFLEYNLNNSCDIIKRLGFSKCHISFAGKKTDEEFTIKMLENKTIATTYTNILSKFLKDNNIKSNVVKMNGSVESSIELGFADIIFDIVQTGSTLKQQSLVELKKVMDFECILMAKNGFKSIILDKLISKIDAVLLGNNKKYIMFNLKKIYLDNVLKILPSANSPTILNLADENYVAIHTLCDKNEIWDVCEKLKQNGAESIIVNDINLMFR